MQASYQNIRSNQSYMNRKKLSMLATPCNHSSLPFSLGPWSAADVDILDVQRTTDRKSRSRITSSCQSRLRDHAALSTDARNAEIPASLVTVFSLAARVRSRETRIDGCPSDANVLRCDATGGNTPRTRRETECRYPAQRLV